MKDRRVLIMAVMACGLCGYPILSQPAKEMPLYLDPGQPVEKRIEDLLARMTLKEKIGQMNMPCVYLKPIGGDPLAKQEGCRRFTVGALTDDIGPGGGFFTLADNALHVSWL